jgi:hypothetical protein
MPSIEEIEKKYNKYKANYDEVMGIVMEEFPDAPEFQIAVLGHIGRETDGTFDYKMKQYNDGPGRGLFQLEDGIYEKTGVDKHYRNYQRWLRRNQLNDSARSQVQYFKSNLTGTERGYNGGTNSDRILESAKTKNLPHIANTIQKRFFHSGNEAPQKTLDYMEFFKIPLLPAQPAE